MASTEGPQRAHADRHTRRRPFATWMKRLANLKNLHNDSGPSSFPRPTNNSITKPKKPIAQKYSPYTYSQTDARNGRLSFNTASQASRSRTSLSHSKNSMSISHDNQAQTKSRAPTLATTAETTISGTGTIATTAARTEGDRDSTFSSPAPSLRSVTTTLTTMQSTAPVTQGNQLAPATAVGNVQPATAIPAHLAPVGHHPTYYAATANNLLSDNASVITLASSSKRGRRRNSLDTNASMRALAPASMFGGSRESLPLSVLSGTVINPGGFADNSSIRDTASSYYPRSTSAMNAERASLISASGVTAPVLTSERNSYIGATKLAGDTVSIRSGFPGHGLGGDRDGATSRADRMSPHGRNDSLGAGSIGANSLLRERTEREMLTAPTSPILI